MKKLALIVVTAALSLALAGCGGRKPPSPPPPNPPGPYHSDVMTARV